MSRRKPFLSVKRSHGLGNVFMLLPVLDGLVKEGYEVHLVTDSRWVGALRRLRPEYELGVECRPETVDLDSATASLPPRAHRTEEFASMLGVAAPRAPAKISVPEEWRAGFLHWQGSIGFAPEAGHPSRRWPTEYAVRLASALKNSPLVLLGSEAAPALPCDFDSRARLSLEELLGLLSQLRLLICMDSGMLHLGAALDLPTVCLFGGIDPAYRIMEGQPVTALQAELNCCPCNKRETCGDKYDCVKALSPESVLRAVEDRPGRARRVIRRV